MIALIAEELISAPASQAFVERIFSLCGILTAGRRNRMKRSLELRAFLKLNCRFLQWLSVYGSLQYALSALHVNMQLPKL